MADNIGGISFKDIMAAAMGDLDDVSDEPEKSLDNSEINESPCNTEDSEKISGDDTENDGNAVVLEAINPESAEVETEIAIAENVSEKSGNEDVFGYDCETFCNNVYAFKLLCKAYRDLRYSIDPDKKIWFEFAVKAMVNELFPGGITYESDTPIKCSVSIDADFLDFFTFEQYQEYVKKVGFDGENIFRTSGLLSLKNVLEYPIVINNNKSFSIGITTDDASRGTAERFVQYLMYSFASDAKKSDIRFRCADKEKGGQSYGKFIGLIGTNKLFGKGIYSNETAIDEMITELNKIAEENVAELKGRYNSVYEYNKENSKKVPVTLAVFCDAADYSYSRSKEELSKVLKNAQSSAISTIFLSSSNNAGVFTNADEQLHITFENNTAFLRENNIKIPMNIWGAEFTAEQFAELEEKLNVVETVDTDFKSHYNLEQMQLFTRDATEGLMIPFAFDGNGDLIDLEIGDATPHALLSGSTGSGKSVTLHTIINQAMINYHPDDVEIWAIDYKAVEFGYYVNKRTPHITVIGQDNSEDFSLGLIDLVKEEYDRRKSLFVSHNCKDFKAYRKMFGRRSLSRILIVVDEFHNLTQAISNYMGEKNYKTILENLLSEMRAMGMSFLFCSQTIAAGLNGLTEKGRNQIGCRLSMKHEDILEIKETLSLSSSSGVDFESIKYLRRGELIYKKISNKAGAEPYSLERVNVLFAEPYRDFIIDKVNSEIEEDYVPREEIICKNSERYCVTEKRHHPISEFTRTGVLEEKELLTVYPGAPTSLSDSFSFELNEEAGNNILLVGENDSMRESIVISSILGMLIDPQNTVVASILDDGDVDNQRLYNYLKQITSDRLKINYGYDETMFCIDSLKKLKPYKNGRIIYLWYGLQKLKNMIFLNGQDEDASEEAQEEFTIPDKIPDGVDPLDFLVNALERIDSGVEEPTVSQRFGEELSYSDCQSIIRKLEEYGSENNRYCFTVYNTLKGLKKARISEVDNYEFRIGLKMSTDDSYDMFGTTSFVSKANESTAVFYSGSKVAKTIRPYLLPDTAFINKFNKCLEE